MATPVSLTISPHVAQYVRRGVTKETRQSGLEHSGRLEPVDQLMLLFCLANDIEPEIKQAARRLFCELPDDVVVAYLHSPGVHPGVRDLIARVHGGRPAVAEVLTPQHQDVVTEMPLVEIVPEELQVANSDETGDADQMPPVSDEIDDEELLSGDDEEEEIGEEVEVDPESEEFLSKYRMAQVMGIGEKIKMALTGDKEWRSLLIKDANKLVSGSVVKNPRITDGEILTILKVGVQNDEIVRIICANKEWVKNYKIRKALVDCPKTPLPNALRYIASLDIKDIAHYAKSKNISSVLSTQAKRMLLAKKR